MIKVPKTIKQLNIHSLNIVRMDTRSEKGDEGSLYLPIIKLTYIDNGEENVNIEPLHTSKADIFGKLELYLSAEEILLDLKVSIWKMLNSGVVVLIDPRQYLMSNPYTMEPQRGRIYDKDEICGIFYNALSNQTTFSKIWSENYFEFTAHIMDEKGNILEKNWMEEEDDLVKFIEKISREGSVLLDIQDKPVGGPSPKPFSGYRKARQPVDSFFVISCWNALKERKTYFAAGINHETEEGKICINYSSTIKGAYHFLNEESALKFAVKHVEDMMNNSFDVEEIYQKDCIQLTDWTEHL